MKKAAVSCVIRVVEDCCMEKAIFYHLNHTRCSCLLHTTIFYHSNHTRYSCLLHGQGNLLPCLITQDTAAFLYGQGSCIFYCLESHKIQLPSPWTRQSSTLSNHKWYTDCLLHEQGSCIFYHSRVTQDTAAFSMDKAAVSSTTLESHKIQLPSPWTTIFYHSNHTRYSCLLHTTIFYHLESHKIQLPSPWTRQLYLLPL